MNIIQTTLKSPMELISKIRGKKSNQRVLDYNADNQPDKPMNNTIGVTGTRIWGDVFTEEYVDDLKGFQGSKAYTKMLRQDYKVGFVETAIMSTIKAAHFNISTPEIPNGELIQEACEWQMKHGFNKTHSDNLNDLGTFKFYGFAAFEPTNWEYYKHDKFGDMWRLHNMGFKTQESIKYWGIDDDTEDLKYIKQQPDSGTITEYVIPGDNLIILTEKRRGANFEGRSILRTAYGPAWRKNIYYKLLGLGFEKSAIGIILVTIPPGKLGTDEETAFLDAVKYYVAHQNSFIKKVGNKLGDQWEGFDVEVITIDFNADSIINAIKLEDSAIASCGSLMFSELGQNGNNGAKALGVAEMDFFYSTIIQDIDYIAQKIQPIYDQFTIYNFGRQKEYAKIEATLDNQMGLEFGQMLNYFSSIGAFHAQPEDEEMFRKKWKMPDYIPPKIELPDDKPTDDKVKPDNKDDDTVDDKSNMSLTNQPDKYVKKIVGKIPFKKFIKQKNDLMDKYNKALKSQLLIVKEKYLVDVKNAITKNPLNPVKAVNNIDIGYKKVLYQRIHDNVVDMYYTGKQQGIVMLESKGIKIKKKLANINDLLPDGKKWVNNTSAVTTSIMVDTTKKIGLLSASNQLRKGVSTQEVIFDVNVSMDKWINNENNLGAGAIVPQALAEGRKETEKEQEIVQTGRIMYNMVPETDICKFLNGKAIREGDPNIERYTEPLHWRCDSYSVPIMSDEEQPAIWDGWNPPDSVINAQQLLTYKHNKDIPEHVITLLNYFRGDVLNG